MMSSEVEGESSPLSRVLFLSDTGEPMRFFLRPGPAKAQFKPIIRAGGGVVCKVQETTAILLSDPEDMSEVPASVAHRYVSTQYVRDCVEKNQQLEVEDYRFRGERAQTRSAKRKREGNGGRVGYTEEEDAAILSYMRGHAQEVRGNRVWQRMEQEEVTRHSWQSMKDRYRKFLAKQQQEPLEEEGVGREKAGVKDGPLDELFTTPVREKEPAQFVHEKDPPPPSPEKANANRSLERTDPQASAEPTHPQPSPERPSPRHTPSKTHPRPSAEPTRPQSIPDRPHPQRTPTKTVPQPSAEPTRPQPSPERTSPRHTPSKTHPRPSAEPTRPQSIPDRPHPQRTPTKTVPQPSAEPTRPQPSPERTSPRHTPSKTHPRPSAEPTRPQSIADRPHPQRTPTKTVPQPSAEPTRPQPSPERTSPQRTPSKTHPRPSAKPTRPQSSPDRPHPQHTPSKTVPRLSAEPTRPQPSPERTSPQRMPSKTHPRPSAKPTRPQSSPDRPHPQRTPSKTVPRPSAEPTRPQPSPERTSPQRTPSKTHPRPSAKPTRPQSSPDRPHPQRTPTKTVPQPSTSKTPPQLPLKHKRPQRTPEITALPERTTPAPSLVKMHPQALSASVQSPSLAGEGNSVEREAAGLSCLSTGRNEQLAVTEEVEKEEQVSARKKTKLSILERAVKEFQDSDESDDTPDIVFGRTTQSADPKDPAKEIPAATSAGVTREDDDDRDNENGDRDNEARSAARPEAPHVQRGAAARSAGREDSGPGQGGSARLASNVHMFLFDRESQEEEPSQPAGDTPFSQAQLKEAKRQLRDLMTRSKQGLVNVTKSLLKTSGDSPAALQYLLTGRGPPGATLWDPRDDRVLLSGDPSQRKLREKYGKVSVAKRIAFLNVE